jgi:hypothetical protein
MSGEKDRHRDVDTQQNSIGLSEPRPKPLRKSNEAMISPLQPAVTTPPAAGPFLSPALRARLEVRPIGTQTGFRELAALHRRTWEDLNVEEKRVHMVLWPLALHFGLYEIRPGEEKKRPRLIGAFWARCLADAPLTLGHLYPASLFTGLDAGDVWEFGGMVIEPNYQGKGLVKMMSETAKLFLFSRRPKLIITNPVEALYDLYRQFGLKAVGNRPVAHPHAYNVKVWLMYGDFEKLAQPYFM